MRIKKLERHLRVKYSVKNAGTLGTEIVLIFQRRKWWFIWDSIYPHHYYCIHVYDFWTMGGPMEDQPMFNSGVCGECFETWKPWKFNFEDRIKSIHEIIMAEEAESKQVNINVWAGIDN